MRTLAELESVFDEAPATAESLGAAEDLLRASEEVIEHWVVARGEVPTEETREGFRLLALHRQGAKGEPSFNACRETCREVVYHYNLITMQPEHSDITDRLYMMGLVSKHLYLFISGKLQVAGLGEFCCSSKPIRTATESQQP
ncbi:MAG: hypothetical protein EX272_08905 [Chromatiales bacterium]|nr:MAG: hypothetical protein EX272_08905 [Chromatiales bacterium]